MPVPKSEIATLLRHASTSSAFCSGNGDDKGEKQMEGKRNKILTALISFIIPLIGIIIFLLNLNKNKELAYHALTWAIIGLLFNAVLWWIAMARGVL